MDRPAFLDADRELAALQRDLDDIRQRMDDWTSKARALLLGGSHQLADVVIRLEALARDARRAVPSIDLTAAPDLTATPALATTSDVAAAADRHGTSDVTAMLDPAAADDELARLWLEMRPYAEKRLRLLEQARDAARSGALDDTQRGDAVEAARQLVGSLGGYGKLEGSAAANRAAASLEAVPVPVDALEAALSDLARSIGVRDSASTGS